MGLGSSPLPLATLVYGQSALIHGERSGCLHYTPPRAGCLLQVFGDGDELLAEPAILAQVIRLDVRGDLGPGCFGNVDVLVDVPRLCAGRGLGGFCCCFGHVFLSGLCSVRVYYALFFLASA